MKLRPLHAADGHEVAAIHAERLAIGHASSRDVPRGWEGFRSAHPLAIAADGEERLLGWTGLGPTSGRETHAVVREVSL